MNEFKLNGSMTVAAIKDLFKTLTGGTLRVKDGSKKADESATIASISEGKNTNGVMQLNAEMTVGDFKSKMFSDFGLKVDVGTPDDWVAVPDGITLGQLRSLPKNAVKAQLEAMVGAKADNGLKETVPDDDYPTYEECCAKYGPSPKANLVKYSDDGKVLEEIGSGFEGPLIIPEGVETLHGGYGCWSKKIIAVCYSCKITAIVMPDSVKKWDKILRFSGINSLEFVRFSHRLAEIPEQGFYCTPVTELRFPEGLKVIGRSNFQNHCGKTCKRVTFPSSLEYILSDTFYGNDLEEIVIPANVKAIFPGAFERCKKMKKITFMSDETVVLPGAFRHCDHIDSDAICKAHQLGDRILGADEVRYDGDTLTYIPPYYCGKLVVKDGTQKIASDIDLRQFDGITELYLPDSLEYNGKYPQNITVLHASDKTTELNLWGTHKLRSFNWPKNLTKIGEGSFCFLYGITSIKIPEGVELIEHGCFSHTQINHLELPVGLKEISWEAFMDNKSLEEVTIPASVEVIGKSAFSGCTSLKKITIEGNPTIKFGAFSKCPGYKKK